MTVWECQLRPECRRETLLEIEHHLNRNYLNRFRPKDPYREEIDRETSIAAEPPQPYGSEH